MRRRHRKNPCKPCKHKKVRRNHCGRKHKKVKGRWRIRVRRNYTTKRSMSGRVFRSKKRGVHKRKRTYGSSMKSSGNLFKKRRRPYRRGRR